MEERSNVKIALKAAGGLAIVVGSFYATLKVMDNWDGMAPAKMARLSSIKIEEATYGGNCPNGGKLGNATQYAAKACDGRARCNILISVQEQELGDPAPGCAKDFSVRLKCNQEPSVRKMHVNAEANGSTLRVDCEKPE
jgi:hypothetical protein